MGVLVCRTMNLPGPIVLRPNDFSQSDYDVIYKDPDGREWRQLASCRGSAYERCTAC